VISQVVGIVENYRSLKTK